MNVWVVLFILLWLLSTTNKLSFPGPSSDGILACEAVEAKDLQVCVSVFWFLEEMRRSDLKSMARTKAQTTCQLPKAGTVEL